VPGAGAAQRPGALARCCGLRAELWQGERKGAEHAPSAACVVPALAVRCDRSPQNSAHAARVVLSAQRVRTCMPSHHQHKRYSMACDEHSRSAQRHGGSGCLPPCKQNLPGEVIHGAGGGKRARAVRGRSSLPPVRGSWVHACTPAHAPPAFGMRARRTP